MIMIWPNWKLCPIFERINFLKMWLTNIQVRVLWTVLFSIKLFWSFLALCVSTANLREGVWNSIKSTLLSNKLTIFISSQYVCFKFTPQNSCCFLCLGLGDNFLNGYKIFDSQFRITINHLRLVSRRNVWWWTLNIYYIWYSNDRYKFEEYTVYILKK